MAESAKRQSEVQCDPTRASKRFKPDYQDAITVQVGPEKTSFIVHRATICAKSKFFEAALSRDWKEATERVVPLPDMTPFEFAIYTHWVYTGEIDREVSGLNPPSDSHSYGGIISAFLAGDVLQDEGMRNAAMNELIRVEESEQELPLQETICISWKRTPSNSPLRRWLVDIFALGGSENCFLETEERNYPPGFLSLVINKLIGVTKGEEKRKPTLASACQYHEHKDTPKCS